MPLTWIKSGFKSRLLILVVLVAYSLQGQTTFLIHSFPDYTPEEDTLFIVGNFNNWNPGDKAFQLKRNANGLYEIYCSLLPRPTEYKITRGSWASVEGSNVGQPIDNRIYNSSDSNDTTFIEIKSWQDLAHKIPFQRKIKLKVYSIPKSTPQDASLFVAGNFNGWNPRDENFKLIKEGDGSYTSWVPIRSDTLEYKFTRGNWSSIEGKANGRARTNRLFINSIDKRDMVKVHIRTWEDLSGDPINPYTFFLLLAAFQGLLLIIAINTIQDHNISANRILSLLILLISMALIGRVSTYGREIFQWQPRLLLLPDFIYFLYGPIFLWYIQTLLMIPSKNNFTKWANYVPAIIHFFAYLPLMFLNTETFISQVVDLSMKKYFIIAAVVALFFNVFYWWKCNTLIKKYESSINNNLSFEQNVEYLRPVIKLKLACLLVWAFTYLIGFTGFIIGEDWVFITNKLTDLIWIFLSLTVFVLGYFAMKQPEIFKLKENVVNDEEEKVNPIEKEENNIEGDVEMQKLKIKLEYIMEEDKPYLNPRLALSDLAEMADSNLHTLSKLINEGFDKNFFDFVNSYRVEEFKKRIILPDYKNQTFLAVAFSVGFNSKTAFNRSFKKLTNSTPRKYLQTYEANKPV